ncbi:MAG TPA: hypothetical protein VG994_01355 [Steroidobacteraceae bacterium]|nr:hypothetical protein [Steroidobacteraceae bacterium]
MSVIRWDPFSDIDGVFDRMLRRSFSGAPCLPLESKGGAKLKKRICIGNTAERTLAALDRDVMGMKPEGFASRAIRKPRGPRPGLIGPMTPV